MADCYSYKPQSKVDWTSAKAHSQFRMWRKEVDRILGGPMNSQSDAVKLNTVFIWAGAHAENLVEARQNEDPTLKIENPKQLLDCLENCLTRLYFCHRFLLIYISPRSIDLSDLKLKYKNAI